MSRQLYYLKDFSGGLNVQDAANLLPDIQVTEAQNAVIGKGYVSKRNGYEDYGHSPMVKKTLTWGDIGGKKWGEL